MATTPHRIDAFTVKPTQKSKLLFGNENHIVCRRKGDLGRYIRPYVQSVGQVTTCPCAASKNQSQVGVMENRENSYTTM